MTINRKSRVRGRREDAPPDPGIIPGGIRDRAMRAAMARGPQPEDKRKTQASQKFWMTFTKEDKT
jgi:hypothetical protein